MYLTKLAQRSGEDNMAVSYSDLASVVQVKLLFKHVSNLMTRGKICNQLYYLWLEKKSNLVFPLKTRFFI